MRGSRRRPRASCFTAAVITAAIVLPLDVWFVLACYEAMLP